MELKQYVNDATRTESRIENVQTNQLALITVLKLFVESGNLLDMIKKNVYYGKEIDPSVWDNRITKIQELNIQEIKSYAQHYRTDKQYLDLDPRLFHAIVGIATESTELVEAILKALENKTDIDHVNIQEELGDLNWYQAIAIDASEADWNRILETNIAKLKHRYPEKFTSENAINRDLSTERQILEDGSNQL